MFDRAAPMPCEAPVMTATSLLLMLVSFILPVTGYSGACAVKVAFPFNAAAAE